MENASKALLISAAVLIVLLLIGVGIRTADSTSELIDQVDSDTQSTTITAFNSKFTKYLSNSASASETRAFIQEVLTNNSINSSHIILLNYYPGAGTAKASIDGSGGHQTTPKQIQWIYNQINDNNKYEIYLTKDCGDSIDGYKDGYIACLSIRKKT